MTKKMIRKKTVQPKLRQKNRQIKARIAKPAKAHVKSHVAARSKKASIAHANKSKSRARKTVKPRAKPVKIPAKPVFKNPKKAAAAIPKAPAHIHSANAAFRSHAIRAHEAIKNFGSSLAQKHRDIHYRFVHAMKRGFLRNQSAEKNHTAHQAQADKKSAAPQKGVVLLNMTKNHMISNKVVFANTTFDKFRGLMFRNRKDVNYALVFDFKKALKEAAAIHMFFVFFPIDVVYLRDSKVVDVHREVKPFTAYLAPKQHADTLIELPQGTIWRSGISVGDEIVTTSL